MCVIKTHLHVHTPSHAHTITCTHIITCTHHHMHTPSHAHTSSHAHTITYTHHHMHTPSHAHTITCTHIITCTHHHMHTSSHAHTITCTHLHAHTITCTHLHAHTSSHPLCTGAIPRFNQMYGRASGPIWLSQLSCVGDETSLFNCTYTSLSTSCTHYNDAGVECPSEWYSVKYACGVYSLPIQAEGLSGSPLYHV